MNSQNHEMEQEPLENRIINIINENLYTWEIENNYKNDIEIINSFCHINRNAIEWLPIDKREVVVEIGDSYGEYSSYLSDAASYIYIFEPDEQRRDIIKLRSKNIENIRFCDQNFSCFINDLPPKVDLFIFHNMSFIKSKDEFKKMIKEVYTKFPDSLSVFLIKNKSGVVKSNQKYNQSPQSNNEICYDYSEIKEIMKEAKYRQVCFFYTYPDSIWTMSVFSDSYLPCPNSLVKYNMNRISCESYVRDGTAEYNDLLDAIKNDCFREKTNDYLVLAGNINKSEIPIYLKYSNMRADYFSIKTAIFSNGQVKKSSTCKAGKRHVEAFYSNQKMLELQYNNTVFKVPKGELVGGNYIYPFIQGEMLSDILDETREISDESFLSLLSEWRDNIIKAHSNSYFSKTKEFVSVFGDVAIPATSKSGTINNIDLIFDNIIINSDGWNIIDFEWCFEFPVPVELILFRAFHYYKNWKKLSEEISEKSWRVLGINNEMRRAFIDAERHFQRFVLGRNVKFL